VSKHGSHDASISTHLLLRIIVGLIGVWSAAEGVVLVGFQSAGSGALGAGVTDPAGQRLVGAHMLVLAPAYFLIAWRFRRYLALLWLPFAAQAAVAIMVAYAIVSGDTELGDGILACSISAILAGLLGYIWITEQRSLAREHEEWEEPDVESASDGEDA